MTVNLSWDPSAERARRAHVSHREGELGKPPITVSNTDSDFANRVRYERAEYADVNIHGALSWQLSEQLSLRPTLFFNRRNEQTDGFDDAGYSSQVAAGAFSEDATTKITGGGLQLAHRRSSVAC
jgi:hypothetical protein